MIWPARIHKSFASFKYNVLPLDWRAVERLNSELMGRPSLAGNRKTYTYYPGQLGLPNDAAPRILNKSWISTADLEIPAGGAEGMVATHGGLVGGCGLYVRDGKPTFVYNYLAVDRFTVTGQTRLPKGRVQLRGLISPTRAKPESAASPRR